MKRFTVSPQPFTPWSQPANLSAIERPAGPAAIAEAEGDVVARAGSSSAAAGDPARPSRCTRSAGNASRARARRPRRARRRSRDRGRDGASAFEKMSSVLRNTRVRTPKSSSTLAAWSSTCSSNSSREPRNGERVVIGLREQLDRPSGGQPPEARDQVRRVALHLLERGAGDRVGRPEAALGALNELLDERVHRPVALVGDLAKHRLVERAVKVLGISSDVEHAEAAQAMRLMDLEVEADARHARPLDRSTRCAPRPRSTRGPRLPSDRCLGVHGRARGNAAPRRSRRPSAPPPRVRT